MGLAQLGLAGWALILSWAGARVVVIQIYFCHRPSKYTNSIFWTWVARVDPASIHHSLQLPQFQNILNSGIFITSYIHIHIHRNSHILIMDPDRNTGSSMGLSMLLDVLLLSWWVWMGWLDVDGFVNFDRSVYSYLKCQSVYWQMQKVKVYRAILKRDLRTFSDMIPYAQIQIGSITKKTLPDPKGGKKPTWNETLQFKTNCTDAKITLYDQATLGNQLIGSGVFDLGNVEGNQKEDVVQVLFQGKVVGKVFIKIFGKFGIEHLTKENVTPSPNPVLNDTDRRTLEQAACNLLGNRIMDKPGHQTALQPNKLPPQSPGFYPQPLIPQQPLFYPQPQTIPQPQFSPQPQYSPQPPQYQIPLQSPQRYNSYPYQQINTSPFSYSTSTNNQIKPLSVPQVYHNPVPGNMIIFKNVGKMNQLPSISRPQIQGGSNPLKDLTDLLL